MLILGCTYHAMGNISIYSQISSSIIVDLGEVRFINYIKMLLMDKDSRSYSYYIDVSLDGKEYRRLFDHSKIFCRSWQYLRFRSRLVRFIKVTGSKANAVTHRRTGSIDNSPDEYDSFDIVALQVFSAKTNNLELSNGVIKPSNNVASVELGAIVENGFGGNNMLNKNLNEFTSHEIGSHILLRFNQPYYIDSMRMLLGNNVNFGHKHSFCIKTSMDTCNWTMAVDKRNENLSEWQEFMFKPRSAIFIKIVGTQTDTVSVYSYCNDLYVTFLLKWINFFVILQYFYLLFFRTLSVHISSAHAIHKCRN